MDDELEISDRLREALRDVAKRDRLEVPAAVDARIRAAALRPRGRLLRLRRVVAAAAAAALLLAVGLWAFRGAPRAGDIDADGSVDIVDAYLLDRRLGSAPARGDVDGDGRIDAADVRRLIETVVSVGRRG